MNIPEDLRYTNEHEWVRVEGPLARVGITDYAQDALGDVVYVALPEVGATVAAATACCEVESTKSVSEVFAPLSPPPRGRGARGGPRRLKGGHPGGRGQAGGAEGPHRRQQVPAQFRGPPGRPAPRLGHLPRRHPRSPPPRRDHPPGRPLHAA